VSLHIGKPHLHIGINTVALIPRSATIRTNPNNNMLRSTTLTRERLATQALRRPKIASTILKQYGLCTNQPNLYLDRSSRGYHSSRPVQNGNKWNPHGGVGGGSRPPGGGQGGPGGGMQFPGGMKFPSGGLKMGQGGDGGKGETLKQYVSYKDRCSYLQRSSS
jgi:hypothetical protein